MCCKSQLSTKVCLSDIHDKFVEAVSDKCDQGKTLEIRPMNIAIAQSYSNPSTDLRILPRSAQNFDDFLGELKESMELFKLSRRPIDAIFNLRTYFADIPHPSCTGTWMEFGVMSGRSINATAQWRSINCGVHAGFVYGFDTFTGLPEYWRPGYGEGSLSVGGNLPIVRSNVKLVQGLFSETLPPWLSQQDFEHGGRMPDITYIHIDCDLYTGSRDALEAISSRISSGCVLIFDELLNYPQFRDHEVKSLWEFLQRTRRKVSVIGMAGPISRADERTSVDLKSGADHDFFLQSAAFVVI